LGKQQEELDSEENKHQHRRDYSDEDISQNLGHYTTPAAAAAENNKDESKKEKEEEEEGDFLEIEDSINGTTTAAAAQLSSSSFLEESFGSGWIEWFDAASNSTYYYHTVTGATQWEYPKEGLAQAPTDVKDEDDDEEEEYDDDSDLRIKAGDDDDDDGEKGGGGDMMISIDDQSKKQLHAAGREKAMITALSNAFRQLESDWISNPRNGLQGSCAVLACLHGERVDALQLYVANLGDSRGVLCRGGIAVPLSEDHKPNRPDEVERIRRNGGQVAKVLKTWRVYAAAHNDDPNGATTTTGLSSSKHKRPQAMLAVSRAFGDRDLKRPKKIVSSQPEVHVVPISPIDLFAVLACDGIFDVLDSQSVVDIVAENWGDPHAAAEAVKNRALLAGSSDDLTVVVVMFAWQAPQARRILKMYQRSKQHG